VVCPQRVDIHSLSFAPWHDRIILPLTQSPGPLFACSCNTVNMRHSFPRILVCVFTLSVLLNSGCKKSAPPPTPQPQSTPSAAATQTANQQQELAFVQNFYDWYEKSQASYTDAITKKPEWFDGPLLAAFRNDAAIQAKAVGEIDGLDYDPFGFGQDASNISGFKTTGVSGDRVSVIAMDIKNQPTPDNTLSLQVRCTSSGCVIVNIFFPDSGKPGQPNYVPAYDMLSELALLHPAKPAK